MPHSTPCCLWLEAKGRAWELAEELRQEYPRIPVLFLWWESARNSQFVIRQGLPFLKKPFTMYQIAGKVREVLNSHAAKTMTAGGSF